MSSNTYNIMKQNAGPLKVIIDKYKLIINNNTNFSISLLSSEISIIYLALSTAALALITLGKNLEEYPSITDHKLILI